jgi:hypothetical protein
MHIDINSVNGDTYLLFKDFASLNIFIEKTLRPRLGTKMNDIWCGISFKRPLLRFNIDVFREHIQHLIT